MGYGNYSNDAHAQNTLRKASLGYSVDSLMYTDDVKSGKVAEQVHQRLDPKRLAGGKVRESRDSEEHPNSVAISVFFDVTGSMGSIPKVLRKKLSNLMKLLTEKGYATDPQVLFGAIGDSHTDRVPLQIGQFESSITMDDDLESIYVEGGGGGTGEEGYELAYYMAARHTAIDCFEKRNKKGYLFTIGDEEPYPAVRAHDIKRWVGDGAQKDIPFEDILKEAQEKYHCFHLIAARGSNGSDPTMRMRWKQLMGDNCIIVEEADFIAEIIALIVGIHEGTISLAVGTEHLKELGVGAKIAKAIEKSLEDVAKRAISLTGLTPTTV